MKVCSSCQRCYSDAADVCLEDGCSVFASAGMGDPEMIRGYILTRRTGAARNAETYEAQEITSGSTCIVKLFSPSADADLILREAKAVRSLFDPGLIGVYDAGTIDDGHVFVVSEIAKGRSLRELLTDIGAPDLLDSIGIIRQAAEVLHVLHAGGLVHGAINPENIFLSAESGGQARVRIDNVDYGRAIEQSIMSNKFEIDSHTSALRYFAPEQCTGGERTPRTDVYSLGVVFYELLAGAPPFDSTKAAGLIEKHRSERPPDVRINNFDLRMLVTHALTESLQKQPAFRQSSANLLARQLRHIEQLATHTSTPPPAVASARVEKTRPITIAPARSVEPVIETRSESRLQAASFGEAQQEVTIVKPRKIERVPVATEEVIVSSLPEVPATSVETATLVKTATVSESEMVNVAPAQPPRSRLRMLKRKLNELSAMVASRMELRATPVSIQSVQDVITKRAPRKIEWVQPEDDLPSIDEVIAARESDPVPIVEPKPQVEQPTIEPVVAVPEPVVPTTSVLEPVVAAPEPVVPATPVIESVVAVPALVVPATPVIEPVIAVPAPAAPAVPVVERVAAVTKPTQPTKPKDHPRQQKLPTTKHLVVTKLLHADDDEEITLVRPPGRRIKVNLEKPRTIYRAQTAFARSADDIAFQPTILGNHEKKTRRPARRPEGGETYDGMFAAHFGSSVSRSDLKFRSMTIGGGIIVLAAVFLFANDSMSSFFQNVSAGDSATAGATGTTAELTTDVRSPIGTASRLPQPRVSSNTSVAEPKRERASTESKAKPKADESRSSNEKVTSKETPKSRKTVDTQRKQAEPESPKPVRRASPDPVGPRGATRPRIVRDPRP